MPRQRLKGAGNRAQCSSSNLPSGASSYLRYRSQFTVYFREDKLIVWAKYLHVELRELPNTYECEHDAVRRGDDPVNQ